MMISGKESILATLNAGIFSGNLMFDHGPALADSWQTAKAPLLNITSSAFNGRSRSAGPGRTVFVGMARR